jgi:hypothetical protein
MPAYPKRAAPVRGPRPAGTRAAREKAKRRSRAYWSPPSLTRLACLQRSYPIRRRRRLHLLLNGSTEGGGAVSPAGGESCGRPGGRPAELPRRRPSVRPAAHLSDSRAVQPARLDP